LIKERWGIKKGSRGDTVDLPIRLASMSLTRASLAMIRRESKIEKEYEYLHGHRFLSFQREAIPSFWRK
jgi:hypothetical protein